ncbi:MAG: thiamine biosynthesis protein ThiS [Phycisphaeraceae bacterium]|nr:thiamine biosynthesis protein ThiS [Phycisphaeraceae bacterium]|tara:strand:+ start:3573 stop:3770 length:198 start_codon:yes stop_codon:yes gene_type:complete
MKITINGTFQETDSQTVRDLVVDLGFGSQPVAVELNRQLVVRRQHEHTAIQEGDIVEIVTLVGGG